MASPDDLERVVATAGGGVAIGRGMPGRGAWLCRGAVACVDAADRRNAFSRALRTAISAEAVAALRSTVADRARMEGFASSWPAAR